MFRAGWTIQKEGDSAVLITKAVDPDRMAFLGQIATGAFLRPTWHKFAQIPSNGSRIRNQIEAMIDQFKVKLIFHSFKSQLADNVGVTEGKGGPWHYK